MRYGPSFSLAAAVLLPTSASGQLHAYEKFLAKRASGSLLRADTAAAAATTADAAAVVDRSSIEIEEDFRLLQASDLLSLSVDYIERGGKAGGSSSGGARGKSGKALPQIDECSWGEPLKVPKQIRSKGQKERRGNSVKAKITLGAADYWGPSYSTPIRVYNGDTIGPTIRVHPGDELELTLINDLDYPLGNIGHNEFQKPNTTNMHTHGLHVSGESPGDNVYIRVDPGQTQVYKYFIGEDHMPGTHWYHPHFHGSTWLQTYTALGMLIVEEPEDYPVPQVVKDMPEIEMIIMESNINRLRLISEASEDCLTDIKETNCITSDPFYFLVNGQYKPQATMEVDTWYRWRIVGGMPEIAVVFELADDADCELQLLAKDGIFLNDAPRSIGTIFIVPGNRADVAMRCQSVEKVNMVIVSYGEHDFDPEFTGADVFQMFMAIIRDNANFPPSFYHCSQAQDGGLNTNCPVLMSIDVVPPKKKDWHPSYPIESFSVNPRPCYLANLEQLPGCAVDCPDLKYDLMTMSINEHQFHDKDTYLFEFDLGTVQDSKIFPIGSHPHHQHVNPFQIRILPEYDISGNPVSQAVRAWYQIGDWADTLEYPRLLYNNTFTMAMTCGGPCLWQDDNFRNAQIRYALNEFSGHMVVHCHKLNHEDLGMMGQFNLKGKEGTVWEGAREENPLCVLPGYTPEETMEKAPCAVANRPGCEKWCHGSKEKDCVNDCIIHKCLSD